MITKADLKATWPGKAIFTDAFMRTLPRTVKPAEPDPLVVSQAVPRKRRISTRNTRFYEVIRCFHGARPGSKRARQLEIVLAHTDTANAKAAGAEGIDISFAEEQGLIKFKE